jgi:zinc protease
LKPRASSARARPRPASRAGVFLFLLAFLVGSTAGGFGCIDHPRGVVAPSAVSAAAGIGTLADLDLATPLAPNIHTGKLANGLTYYVLNHAKPAARAALWLAVDVGSLVEDEDQRGLAHFVEHVAFRGTKRFPKLAITHYLEKVGMRLGADVNAHTGYEETLYELTLPSDDGALLGKGLDILRDIAGDVTFAGDDVDKERKAVLEELRLDRGVWQRVGEQETAAVLRGTRFAERRPLGLVPVIMSATPAKLARFYDDWYRPESMAVIAVGDFDPAALEAAIKARFADLVARAPPRPHVSARVPRDYDSIIAVAKDAELPSTSIVIYEKEDYGASQTKRGYRRNLVERLYCSMMETRLGDLTAVPGSPFVDDRVNRQKLTRNAAAIFYSVTVKDGRIPQALGLLFRALVQAERRGFSPAELSRATRELLADAERTARDKDEAPLDRLARELTRNFFEHEEIPGPDLELAWTRELLPTIKVEDIARLAALRNRERGQVVTIAAPANVKVPSEQVLRITIYGARQGQPEGPWEDTAPAVAILDKTPAPGRVVRTVRDPVAGATVWTLANGVRVVVKPTTFTSENVLIEGWAPGGTSVVADGDFASATFAGEIIADAGTEKVSEREINRLISGKSFSLDVGVDELGASMKGEARADELETMLQLLYARLTAPGHWPNAFDIWRTKRLEAERHRADQPEERFDDEIRSLVTSGHPRRRPVSAEMIEQVSPERVYAVWKNQFDDCGAFTFVFVGRVDLAKLQPLVETYLGSLPAKPVHAHWKDIGVRYPEGKVERVVTAGTEPKSYVWLAFSRADPWTLEAERDLQVLQAVLQTRLRDVLRWDLGGVYDVAVRAHSIREPVSRQALGITFACAPENVDKLRAAVFAEMASLAKNGVEAARLGSIAEQLRRQHALDLKSDGWWRSVLRDAYYHGDETAQLLDFDALLHRVTSDAVQATVRRMFDDQRYWSVVLRPAPAP